MVFSIEKLIFFENNWFFRRNEFFNQKICSKCFSLLLTSLNKSKLNIKIIESQLIVFELRNTKITVFLCNLLTYLFGCVKCDKPTSKSQSRFDWFDLFCVLISIEPYDLLWFLLLHKKIYNLSVYNYIFKYRNSFTWMLIGVLNTGC